MLDIELKNMSTVLSQLDAKAQDIISVRAVNKVGAQARTAVFKSIFEDYSIKKKNDFKKRIYYFKATKGAPAVIIRASKRWRHHLSLTKFPAKQTPTGSWAQPRGKKIAYKHAFIAKVKKSGHEGIFWRTGKKMATNPKKDAIREVTGPTPGALLGRKKTKRAVMRVINQKYHKLLMHEIEYYFASKSRRGSRRRAK